MAQSETAISDTVTAALVDCLPAPAVVVLAPAVPPRPDESPVTRARAATIEQTGAGPPPDEV